MPAAKKTPAKTSVKPGTGQVLDIAKPGELPPTNATSKPVIVTNRVLVQDPMVLQPKSDAPADAKKSETDASAKDTAAAPVKPPGAERRRELTIQPLSKDLKPASPSIKVAAKDTETPTDNKKPATTDELAAAMAESADSAIAEAAAVEAAMAVSSESSDSGSSSEGEPDAEAGSDADKAETAPELNPEDAETGSDTDTPKPIDITGGNDAMPVDTPSLSSDDTAAAADTSADTSDESKEEPATDAKDDQADQTDAPEDSPADSTEPDASSDDTESHDDDTEEAPDADAATGTPSDASSSTDQPPADIAAAAEPGDDSPTESGKDGAAANPQDPAQVTAKAEAEAKEKAAFEELVDSKKYFLPINSLEKRRSQQVAALGILFTILLIAAWLNIALDAGFIELNGVKPLTDLF
jgi:hypothetical protein